MDEGSVAVVENSHAAGAYLVTLLSGLSTGIGGLIVIACGVPNGVRVGLLQSFAAGMMILLSLMELLGPALEHLGLAMTACGFCVGALLLAGVSALVPDPSEDMHHHFIGKKAALDRTFLRIGIVTAIGISLHNFPEGLAVFLTSMKGLEYGIVFGLSIALHNIPEGITVAAPIYAATHSRLRAVGIALASGLFEPLGALLAGLVLHPFLTQTRLYFLLALVGGVMVWMSVRELIPVSLEHAGRSLTVVGLAAGCATCMLMQLLLPDDAP